MLIYSKIRKINLELLFLNKFCVHAVLLLPKPLLITQSAMLWLSKFLLITKMSFRIGDQSYKYIKIWLFIKNTLKAYFYQRYTLF